MPENAVAYARASLDRDGTELAVKRQLTELRRRARDRKVKLLAEYVDNDVSASGKRTRPEFDAMLRRIEAGGVDTVLAWDLTRLTRNRSDELRLVETCQAHGVMLMLVQGSDIDAASPIGRLLLDVLGSVARHEIEVKGARQKLANRQRAEVGVVKWTVRPFGYDQVDGRVVAVEEEAEVIKAAAARLLDGDTLQRTAGWVQDTGHTTTRGKAWSLTTLRRLLLNPRLSGRATYLGVVTAAGDWPAILSPDQQDELRLLLMDPARRTAKDTRTKYLLSGLALCGVPGCGRVLFASPAGAKGSYYMTYRCRTAHLTRRMDYVDAVAVDRLLERMQRPDARELLDDGDEGAGLQAEAALIRDRLDSLAELLGDGTLTPEGVRKESARLRARLGEVEQERAAVAGNGPLARLVDATDARAEWDRMDLIDRRSAIRAAVTVTVLPVTKGARFSPEQVRVDPR